MGIILSFLRLKSVSKDFKAAKIKNLWQSRNALRKSFLKSPYIHDAENVIINIYDEMKALGKFEEFQKVAKEYNINIEE